MQFIQVINNKKFTLISIFLLIYLIFNFLDGERGLISFYEKIKVKEQLLTKEKNLTNQLAEVNRKNILLTESPDIDYIETLFRKKFMVGKKTEKIYLE